MWLVALSNAPTFHCERPLLSFTSALYDPQRRFNAGRADNISDPEEITGGWLVEIDNYLDDDQITINEGNGELIRLTYKSPEVLSDAQSDYLKNLATAADRAIYANDKSSTEWENIIDIDSLAKQLTEAKKLIALCEAKLTAANDKIDKILAG